MREWIPVLALCGTLLGPEAWALTAVDLEISERPGASLPVALPLRDASGSTRALGDLLDSHTASVLVLSYFRCPLLCDQILAGLVEPLQDIRRTGVDYRVLAVSFDPMDTPADAARKQQALLEDLEPADRARWHVTVGVGNSADVLADSVGFKYWKDPATGQFGHAAVIMTISPDRRVSGYLYGVSFTREQLAAALRTAAGGRTLTTVDRVLLRCYQYIPALRAHADAVAWILRVGTLGLFSGFALGIVWLVRREHARRR